MKVGIVEDDAKASDLLKKHFARYSKENGVEFSISEFGEAISFLTAYRSDYDLVMLDIEMPLMDGMTAAEKLREIDPYVILVFVTNMRQYAINGYAVNALDFVVKPVAYFDFCSLINKIRKILATNEEKDVAVYSAGILHRIPSSHISYVEIYRHKLTLHTQDGKIEAWGSLSDIEKQVPPDSFSKCNNCYLVNLKYVEMIEKEDVIIGEDRLKISHLRHKDFVRELTRYLGRRR